MTQPASKPPEPGSALLAPRVRLLIALLAIIGSTGGAIGVALLWTDRPRDKIQQALDRGEFAVALDLADKCLAESPDDFQTLSQKARALSALRSWNEALPVLNRLNEQFPDDGDLLHELSACEFELGNYDESVRCAERLSQLPSFARRGRVLLGILQYRRGNNRLAIQAWEPLLEHDSDLSDLQVPAAEFLLAYGRALLKVGRPADGLELLERSIRIDPTAEALDSAAEASDGLGDRPRAVKFWEQAVSRSSDDRSAREGLAQAALEDHSPTEAARWLRPLLARDDLTSSTAFLAQRVATVAGNKEVAARWAARASSLRDRENKLNALEQGLRDVPHSYSSRCLRAHRFASEGNRGQALIVAEDLLKQNSDDPFVRELLDAIRNQRPLPPLDSIPIELH
jgi:tetratricopeptide (TPR) repeat protein